MELGGLGNMIVTIILVAFCWIGIMLQGRKALIAFILVSLLSGIIWIGLNQLLGFNYNEEYAFYYVFGPLIPGDWFGFIIPTIFVTALGFIYIIVTAEKDLDRFYRQNKERQEQDKKELHV